VPDNITVTLGGRTVIIRPLSEDKLIQTSTIPKRPADDSPYLQLWNEKTLPSSLPAIRNHLAATYGVTCRLCLTDVDMTLPGTHLAGPQVDHITPRCDGGVDTWGNVQLVHAACNNVKNGGSRERTAEQYAANLAEAVLFKDSLALAVGEAVAAEHKAAAFAAQIRRVKKGSSEPADLTVNGDTLSTREGFLGIARVFQNMFAKEVLTEWAKVDKRAAAQGHPTPVRGFTASMISELPALQAAEAYFGSWVVCDYDDQFAGPRRRALEAALEGLPAAVAADAARRA